eukprot:jgi/Botrbrau1/17417/Bobra.0054s0013.1
MSGIATLLLAVHCKKTDAVDLKGPLSSYIKSSFSDQQANEAADDLSTLQTLRNEVAGLTGTLPHLKEQLAKYYRALSLVETRFPISKDHGDVNVSFTWYDAFRASKRTEQFSVHFEKASILFNIGAVVTQQALAADRSTDAGLKDASRKFQEAAGIFALLKDVVSLKVESPRPVDISPECAAMLEKLCLAQAQEVVFQKAKADNKAPGTLARLAQQAGVFYDEIQKELVRAPLNQHFDKSWTAHVCVKSALYLVEAQLQSGAALHAADEIASEIARLKEAQLALLPIKKEAKQCSKELQDALANSEATLNMTLAKAERENATVYLQRIPKASDLPPILPSPLVKPIPPTDLDASGEGLFHSVIPDNSAKALSKYTEMVDGLVREQTDKLEAASDEARLKLREWDLPDCLQALDAGSVAALPDGVRLELEHLEDHGGLNHLLDLATQIKELRKVAETELGTVEELLERESAEDNAERDKFGSEWTRPSSSALNSNLREKVAVYRQNLKEAAGSDARLFQRLEQNQAAFGALGIDAAISQMPRLQAPMVNVGSVEPATVVGTLRQALAAVEKLSSERAGLEEALKVERNKDNLLPKLMANASQSPDALFKEEIKKYDSLKASIQENLSKQAQLMEVIGSNQAAYKQVFGFPEWRAACEAAAEGMKAKLREYGELRDNMSEGLRFYMSLQEAIAKLKQLATDFGLTRTLQREDMLENIRKKSSAAQSAAAAAHLAQLNLQSAYSGPPQAYPPAQAAASGSRVHSPGAGAAASHAGAAAAAATGSATSRGNHCRSRGPTSVRQRSHRGFCCSRPAPPQLPAAASVLLPPAPRVLPGPSAAVWCSTGPQAPYYQPEPHQPQYAAHGGSGAAGVVAESLCPCQARSSWSPRGSTRCGTPARQSPLGSALVR